MRKCVIAAAALLSTVATAYASGTGDWIGVVKVQASYDDPTYTPKRLGVDIAVDVVYDRRGPDGKAWGTFSIMSVQDTAHNLAATSRYYHAICVNKFSPDRWSVVGEEIKSVGPPFPKYVSLEFDNNGSGIRTNGATTLAAALTECKAQSGIFPGVFDHGYFDAY